MCYNQALLYVTSNLLPLLKPIIDFSNSNFFTATIGAFAGAYGGQYIVEKSKTQDELKKGILRTNAAIMMGYDIWNAAIALKKQHIKSLKESFDLDKKRIKEFQGKHKKEDVLPGEEFVYTADFKTLAPLKVTVNYLQNFVLDKIELTGRPLVLITTLIRTLDTLNDSIIARNEMIEHFKFAKLPEEKLMLLYFGLPDAQGHINQSYSDYLEAIYQSTDDVMFFSELLCQDLIAHGQKLAAKLGKNAPKVQIINFQKSVEIELLPDQSQYKDWLIFMKKA